MPLFVNRYPSSFQSLRWANRFNSLRRRSVLMTSQYESFSTLCALSCYEPVISIDRQVLIHGEQTKLASEPNVRKRLRCYSWNLGLCSVSGLLNEGKTIHGQLLKVGIDPDLHLWNSLVNFYAKSGEFGSARQVLDEMPEWDVVSWTSLITGLVNEGNDGEGIALFCQMAKEGIRANEFTMVSGLKACSSLLDLDFGEQFHAQIIKIGVCADAYVGSSLINLYANCGDIGLARVVFDHMPMKNVVSWNEMLNAYAEMGCEEETFALFNRITESKVKFSKFTLSSILKGCANSRNLKVGQVVHSIVSKLGFELDEFVSCSLLCMYSKCELVHDAINMFSRIQSLNIVAYTVMISNFNCQGWNHEAAKLYSQMTYMGGKPNVYILTALVRVATSIGDGHFGKSVHATILKNGFHACNFISNTLVTMYLGMASTEDGFRVFNTIKKPDLVSWNSILSGFYGDSMFEEGFRSFKHILAIGLRPDVYTFVSVLRCCICPRTTGYGNQVHAHVVKYGLNYNCYVGTSLIEMYSNSQSFSDAIMVFNMLEERDPISWTVIISEYAKNNQEEKAIGCFICMLREGLMPNEFTIPTCLSSCSNLGDPENGRLLHCLAIKIGLESSDYVASSLMHMYNNCGHMTDADAVFKGLGSPTIVSWNAIINGYSQNGQGEKALGAFRMMLGEGVSPDEITFNGVLSGCSQLGLIEEGIQYFKTLTNIYGIIPSISHYASIINLLCRAGKLNEVTSFIEEMNLTQNALIWETILWACKVHENVEIGQRAMQNLLELDSESECDYIRLSHIFAIKGRWDDAAKTRDYLSSRGIIKHPGCSWVVINDSAHLFFAQDNSNSLIQEIHFLLQVLSQQAMSMEFALYPPSFNVFEYLVKLVDEAS